MFFGRQAQLGRMLLHRDKSFAIFGGRRVGKTSLLIKLRSELRKEGLDQTVFFTAQGVKDIVDFCHRLLAAVGGAKIEPKGSVGWYGIERTRNDLRKEVLLGGRRVTVLIDEVDDLVKVDQPRGEPVMNMLRSLNEELHDKCRFVFAGFRLLYDRLIYYYSPVMNFLEPMPLGGLDSKAARRLIEVPLRDYLGYDISKPEVVHMAMEYSSRSPWQVQHFCGRLVQLLEEEQKDIIDEGDVRQVFEDYTYRTEVVETVLANLSVEQMAILCLFLDSAQFTRDEVYKAFEREQLPVDLGYLGRQLNQMVKFGVFGPPKEGRYTFVYSHLPTVIRDVEAPDRLLSQAVREIRQIWKHRRQ